MSEIFTFRTRTNWESYIEQHPNDYLTIWELVNYPVPEIIEAYEGGIETPPSVSNNQSWSKLVDIQKFPYFDAQYIRPMLGPEVYSLKTTLTHEKLKEQAKLAARLYQPITSEDHFSRYCGHWFSYIINAMMDAVAEPVGVTATITWSQKQIPRTGNRRNNLKTDGWMYIKEKDKTDPGSPTETEYDTMDGVKLKHGVTLPGERALCVVGENKLARNWTSQSIRPVLGKGARGLLSLNKRKFAPLRQIATYSLWGQTRWNMLFTSDEVIIGRAYKAKETPEGFFIYEDEDMAPDDYLGLEIVPIRWEQSATPRRLSALEGVLACTLLSLHTRYRRLVSYEELPPLNRWFSVQQNDCTYYQHSLTRTITIEKPEGVEPEPRDLLLQDNSNEQPLKFPTLRSLTVTLGSKAWK